VPASVPVSPPSSSDSTRSACTARSLEASSESRASIASRRVITERSVISATASASSARTVSSGVTSSANQGISLAYWGHYSTSVLYLLLYDDSARVNLSRVHLAIRVGLPIGRIADGRVAPPRQSAGAVPPER